LRGYNLQHFEAWLKIAKQGKESPPLPLQEEFITASLKQPKPSSLEVFISYSRADSDLARRLNDDLSYLVSSPGSIKKVSLQEKIFSKKFIEVLKVPITFSSLFPPNQSIPPIVLMRWNMPKN
jgi:hypothetical protein